MKKALLVEDMPVVCDTITRMLSALNIEVDSVETPDEALDRLRKSDGYDLLISDAVIPRSMSGDELALLSRKEKRDLPVLLTVGFAGQFEKLTRQIDDGVSLLRKPFGIEELSKAVDEALEKAPA